MTGNIDISIDKQRILADEKWDGLKGYNTNTNLAVDLAVAQYNQ